MGERGKLAAIWFVTVLGWLAMIVDATPLGHSITFEMGRLGLITAAIGSTALLLRNHSLPVVQVYEAGRAAGRAEARAEPQTGERRLRIVDRV